MGRGLILGLGWGVVMVIVAASTLSLIYSNDDRAAVVAEIPAEPAEQPEHTVQADNAATSQETETAVQQAEVQTASPEITAPTPDTTDMSASTPAAPAPAPDVTTTTTQSAGISTNEQAADMGSAPSDPVRLSENSALPQRPIIEPHPEVDTQADAMTPPLMQDGPDAGAAPEGEMSPDVEMAALPKAQTPDPVALPTPGLEMSEDQALPDTTPNTPPEAAPKDDNGFDQARVSVPKMRNFAPNVRTNRLPSIGAGPAVAEASLDTAPDTAQNPAPDLGALETYAMKFENPDAKPMFSVLLIDDPKHPISDEILSHLPFALSFAIDAVREDATKVAARYRAAGFEVLMLTNLPQGANAADIETAFGAYSRAIPEAVGVLDLGANGFLRGPGTATQIAGIMSEKGYGLVTPSKGLNSAQKAATREGVPAVLLFRELDAEGEKTSVIRRYLDRAAFRAAQEGSVIMLGNTRPETVEAVVAWALQDRAASVAIAPVSAVLLAQ